MDYNDLLQKLNTDLETVSTNLSVGNSATERQPENPEDTSNMLNKIGLEIQRQGGN